MTPCEKGLIFTLEQIQKPGEFRKYFLTELNKQSFLSVNHMIDYCREICPELPCKDTCNAFLNTLQAKDKGSLGKIIEYAIFGQKPNNDSSADLTDIDIKVTHFKKLKNNNYNAKERLTITNCGTTFDYNSFNEIKNSACLQDSKYYSKCQKGLLFVIEHSSGKNKSMEELLKQKVLCICSYDMNTFKLSWKEQIDKDYTNIRERALNETISQKGQKYLHIHPHGSKNSGTRALGFKNKFLTELVGHCLEEARNVNNILEIKNNSVSIKLN